MFECRCRGTRRIEGSRHLRKERFYKFTTYLCSLCELDGDILDVAELWGVDADEALQLLVH